MANIVELQADMSALTTEQIQFLRRTLAKGATDDEFSLYIYLCKAHKLNPFMKEAWCTKYGDNPATIMVSRDGLLAIARRTGRFARIVSDVIRDGDYLEWRENGTFLHRHGEKRGDITQAWAAVYFTDAPLPQVAIVDLKEFKQNFGVWPTKPGTMLKKVAEVHALRRAFSITGLYAEEEMPVQYARPVEDVQHTVVSDVVPPAPEKKPSKYEAFRDAYIAELREIALAEGTADKLEEWLAKTPSTNAIRTSLEKRVESYEMDTLLDSIENSSFNSATRLMVMQGIADKELPNWLQLAGGEVLNYYQLYRLVINGQTDAE